MSSHPHGLGRGELIGGTRESTQQKNLIEGERQHGVQDRWWNAEAAWWFRCYLNVTFPQTSIVLDI